MGTGGDSDDDNGGGGGVHFEKDRPAGAVLSAGGPPYIYAHPARHTLVKIDLKVQGEVIFEFKEGTTPSISQSLNNIGFTRSVTTQRYGNHYFCLLNPSSAPSTASIQLAIGKHARDFGSSHDNSDMVGALKSQARIAT